MKITKLFATFALLSLSVINITAQQYKFPFQDPDLPVDQRVDDLISRLTLEEKVSQMQNVSPAIERLGVTAYEWWNEALHGVARVKGVEVTVYPQAIAMAASFNAPLLEQVASAISDEGRALFNKDLREGETGSRYRGLTYWTPNINIFRDPRWGRGQETYGEDPFLTATMGSAMVRGLQGDDPFYLKSSACAKHFAVHSGPEYNRHVFNATTSPYDLWDTYLPAFKALVEEAKVTGVMGAYNRHEGVPCSGSTLLLDDILREDWGFEGYVTSDCGGIRDFYTKHATHKTAAEAAAAAVAAGTDVECGDVYKSLTKAVAEGLITERQLNKSLKQLYTIRMRLGMFDPRERDPYSSIGEEVLNCEAHKALSLKMAHESVVLLKNEKRTLPLNPSKIKRIAVVGPNANDENMMLGNYFGYPSEIVSVLEGIEAKFSSSEVTYIEGCGIVDPLEGVSLSAVAAQAKLSDVIIFAGGINANYEGEEKKDGFGSATGFSRGDRETIALPAIQLELLKALKATGRPVIFVNFSGSVISMEWA
ncbi:MAG: glycoside hydrolase family 3 N-terminal domain-containing protein [Rikenellaceae bacterium]